uniref:Uncharacterized protein n=1 Tax=Anguilla anguilla TaxID=7936 RepID=A0A0E9RAW0_ANGAN
MHARRQAQMECQAGY